MFAKSVVVTFPTTLGTQFCVKLIWLATGIYNVTYWTLLQSICLCFFDERNDWYCEGAQLVIGNGLVNMGNPCHIIYCNSKWVESPGWIRWRWVTGEGAYWKNLFSTQEALTESGTFPCAQYSFIVEPTWWSIKHHSCRLQFAIINCQTMYIENDQCKFIFVYFINVKLIIENVSNAYKIREF